MKRNGSIPGAEDLYSTVQPMATGVANAGVVESIRVMGIAQENRPLPTVVTRATSVMTIAIQAVPHQRVSLSVIYDWFWI